MRRASKEAAIRQQFEVWLRRWIEHKDDCGRHRKPRPGATAASRSCPEARAFRGGRSMSACANCEPTRLRRWNSVVCGVRARGVQEQRKPNRGCLPRWTRWWNQRAAAIPSRRCAGRARACDAWPTNCDGKASRSVSRWSPNCWRSWATACRPTARPAKAASHPDRNAQFEYINAAGAGVPDARPAGDLGGHEEEGTGRRLQERRPGVAPQGPARRGARPRLPGQGAGQGDPLRRLRPGRQRRLGQRRHRPRHGRSSPSERSAAGGAKWARRVIPAPPSC